MKGKKKKKEKKRPTAHEIATDLLKENPAAHLPTLGILYSRGVKVPKEGIENLITAFKYASEFVSTNCITAALIQLHAQQKEQKE